MDKPRSDSGSASGSGPGPSSSSSSGPGLVELSDRVANQLREVLDAGEKAVAESDGLKLRVAVDAQPGLASWLGEAAKDGTGIAIKRKVEELGQASWAQKVTCAAKDASHALDRANSKLLFEDPLE